MPTPEELARQTIDRLLEAAGWQVQDKRRANLAAQRGVALRELSFDTGEPDYTLFVDGRAIGVVEAKPEGHSLIGVETQSARYLGGPTSDIRTWAAPLPFSYESTGVETRFTNHLDPLPRSRATFAFHRPETLLAWFKLPKQLAQSLGEMPTLIEDKLWPPQITAIHNLERSLAAGAPRALIQMATGSGKTFTAVNFVYRQIKYGGARRVLFLVDRGNLGEQTMNAFQQFVSPVNQYKFTEEYIVQHLTSNVLDTSARVVIATIQRLYSMLRGEQAPAPDLDERSVASAESLFAQPLPVEYNPAFPIETFDVIITDECHRSIYNLWRQVLEYFDARLIGLTATPSKQTLGFFNQNLVMDYDHERAVADGVNVNYDVHRIRTAITEGGSTIESGLFVDKRDRRSRKVRWEQLDDDLIYGASALDRDVVARDQIRTVLTQFRDDLFTTLFPGRTDVPKTLIFAKDDAHADDIVELCREVFGKGNDFCQKITYRTTGDTPRNLIARFRNSYDPRIAVTVDMIATGTDIKPLEIVFFMRSVQSLCYFEQMKGRGVRVIDEAEMEQVNPGVRRKTHFVIVDAVGVTERDKTDSRPLDRQPFVPLAAMLDALALGNREPALLESLGARLLRLDKRLDGPLAEQVRVAAGGTSLAQIAADLLEALDPDACADEVRAEKGAEHEPTEDELREAGEHRAEAAAAPLAGNPDLRELLKRVQTVAEQVIDVISRDQVLYAGPAQQTRDTAGATVASFREYLEQHMAEIEALQILYSRPYRQRLTEPMLKELEQTLRLNRGDWTEDRLWEAFATAAPAKVRGRTQAGRFADLVALVRFALDKQAVLEPFAVTVSRHFERWLADQAEKGKTYTPDQQAWLARIRDHIAVSVNIVPDDFEYAPFNQEGGLGKANQLFGDRLPVVLAELNERLVG